MTSSTMYEVIRRTPKVDLHRHLQGSIRLETLYEIVKEYKIDLGISLELLENHVRFNEPVGSLSKYLKAWNIFNKVTSEPEAIERIAFEAVEDAYLDGVRYLELRFSIMMCGLAQGIESVSKGVRKAQVKYDLPVSLILGIPRDRPLYGDIFNELIEGGAIGYDFSCADNLVGFDITGDQAFEPYRFESLLNFFRELGAKVTVHAGETKNDVMKIVSRLNPDRIGHGIAIAENPEEIEMIKKLQIPLEICITSNYLTGAVRSIRSHPLGLLYEAGVPLSVNSDSPSVCCTSMTGEFLKAIKANLIAVSDVERITLDSIDQAFVDEKFKEEWKEKFFANHHLNHKIEEYIFSKF